MCIHVSEPEKGENEDYSGGDQSDNSWQSNHNKAQCPTDARVEVPSFTVWSTLTTNVVKEEIFATDDCAIWLCVMMCSQQYLQQIEYILSSQKMLFTLMFFALEFLSWSYNIMVSNSVGLGKQPNVLLAK